MTEAAGFTPLTVSDIERILAQAEPPRAMPGVKPPSGGALLEDPMNESMIPQPWPGAYQYGKDVSGTTRSLGQLINPTLNPSHAFPGERLEGSPGYGSI